MYIMLIYIYGKFAYALIISKYTEKFNMVENIGTSLKWFVPRYARTTSSLEGV